MVNAQSDEIHTLRRKLSDLDHLEGELERYTITKTAAGQFVYAIRDAVTDENTDIYYACPQCFKQREISMLQPLPAGKTDKFHKSRCTSCKNVFLIDLNSEYKESLSITEAGRELGGDCSPWLKL